VQRNSIDVARKLIEEKANINQVDSRKMTPLMHAAHNGNAEAVSLLLKNNADVCD
jgi:ankyrin repeat protein